ncbi:MAG: chromate efflux transporter [Rhodopila sp.]|nr:chromate efflux transporter [Rhodopila sp.]
MLSVGDRPSEQQQRTTEADGPHDAASVSRLVIFLAFIRLGATAFGGPAMIPRIEQTVTERGWLPRQTVRTGIALAQFLPGATVMQVAGFVGYRLRGISGAAVAFLGFAIPAFIIMLGLAAGYRSLHHSPIGAAVFTGMQAVVAAIIAHATVTFGRRAVGSVGEGAIAAATAAAFLAGLSPALTVVLAAALGALVLPKARPSTRIDERLNRRAFLFPLLLLGSGIVAALLLRSVDAGLFTLAAVMAKVGLFAFGGAYGSLPLMFHEVVDLRHWMDPASFLDGFAFSQVTPGPILTMATFIGWNVAGLLGAVIATVAIFFPSFVVLTAAVPVLDRLRGHRLTQPAMRGAAASLVGLLVVMTYRFGILVPWSVPTAAFAVGAFGLLLAKINPLWVILGIGAIAPLVLA